MDAEGWYQDPFGAHEARWISAGTPTALVRDAGEESHDPPPDAPMPTDLVPVGEVPAADGEDLLRADAADGSGFDPDAEAGSAWEGFGATTGGD